MAATLTLAPPQYGYCFDNIFTTITTGQFSGRSNLAAIVDVYDRTSGSDVLLLRLRQPYNPTATTIDIASLFDLSPELPPTTQIGANPSGFQEISKNHKKYRIGYADSYDLPYSVETLLYSAERFAFYGKNPFLALAAPLAAVNFALFNPHLNADNYTTAQKTLTAEQPEFITFFAKTTGVFDAVVTITVNTGATVVVNLGSFSVAANKAYIMPQGWTQLALNAATLPANTQAVSWKWELKDGLGAVYMQTQYRLDARCYTPSVFLAFDNGLGGISTLHTLAVSEKIQVERETVQKTRWTDFTTTNGEFDNINNRQNTVFEVETNILPRTELQILAKILSGKAWLIDTVNNRFIRILIESKDINLNSKATEQRIRLAYRYAFEETIG
jgi:hypothetical protein